MKSLSNLTIIIPTYNRAKYIIRNILFWKDYDVYLIILDGSDEPLPDEILNNLSKNINYNHLPISFHERMLKSIDLIKTKYSLLMCDDEFYLPTALIYLVNQLELDNELVACTGRTVAFKNNENQISTWKEYNEMANYSITQESPEERMLFHMKNYTSILYSIVKTPIWKDAMVLVSKTKDFSLFAIEEVVFEMSVSFWGKSKVFPILYWFRSKENDGVSWNYRLPFHRWFKSKDKIKEVNKFNDILLNALSNSNLKDDNLMIYIKEASEAFSLFSKNSINDSLIKNPIIYLGLRSPRFIKNTLGSMYKIIINSPLFYKKQKEYTFYEPIKDLESEGVIINYDDLHYIKETLYKFHNLNIH
jgi:glycosyltransferase domain-containing protein